MYQKRSGNKGLDYFVMTKGEAMLPLFLFIYFFISLFLYFFISLFLYFFISLFLYFFVSLFLYFFLFLSS